MTILTTDYLIIGAGAAAMAFVDTLLTEQPNISVTIVDKHGVPGGHWNDAYGHVHLHQPSLLYGVQSEKLEGKWSKLILMKFTLPWNHRASKVELLDHYKNLMDKWVSSGRVTYYPNCFYDFSKKPEAESKEHTFMSLDGSKSYNIKVNVKLVNGVLGEPIVPSKSPPSFPVEEDENIKLITPNDLYEISQNRKNRKTNSLRKYVVLGNGKTAMDAVVFLQRQMGVKADNITWVIPNDVWMIRREGPGSPLDWPMALLEADLDVGKAGLLLEQKGVFDRLDKNITPTKLRFAVIGADELSFMRKVKNIVRRGRVTSIAGRHDENDQHQVHVEFQNGEPLVLSSPQDYTFIHATSPGPFNNGKVKEVFPNDSEINLLLLFAPPVPISMSTIAVLESRRRKGLLDLDFGRELIGASNMSNECAHDEEKKDDSQQKQKHPLSDNEVLKLLIQGLNISADSMKLPQNQIETLKVFAALFSLFDNDVMGGRKWMGSNRLSILSIPGKKSEIFETIQSMKDKATALNLSEGEVKMLSLYEQKLRPLEGI